jgi:hypothetical protein
VALGRTPKKIRQIRKIMMNTIFRLPQGNRRISVLFNIDAEDNFIFQRLTIEINLPSKRMDRSRITINKYKIYIYSRYQLPIVTIDFYRK